MNPLEIALSTAALAFGIAVSAVCILSIRRMRDPEPDLEAVDRFIARAPQPDLLPLSRDVLADVRVVAFDAFGTLLRIDEPRRPWTKIIRRAARRRDPRLASGTIRAFAEASGARWDPAWEEDLQVKLGSIRIRRFDCPGYRPVTDPEVLEAMLAEHARRFRQLAAEGKTS
ncbi:hypothetical protein V8J36_20525 [Frigidibacter sp. MR17.14]|uniref:hypothetical protein n=1 Tax=Frigidibacter sp. MR17.14 TaxID=3126509 RepID=UPI003012C50F